MRKLRVLMLDLKSYYRSPAYQLALLVAYACLEKEVTTNIEFIFTEHPRDEPAEKLVQTILSADADLVAASNYAWNYKKICQTLDSLTCSQTRLPHILLGGPNSAGKFGMEMMIRYPIITAMVEGEGEPAFRDICLSMADSPTRDHFASARNCVYRTSEGKILKQKESCRIQHLDEIPSPYLTGIIQASPSPIFYETNRGCPYRCSFCYWGNGNSKVYKMSHERIREEMEFFAKQKASAFWLADANFGIFPDDSEIAEIMCEINSRYGFPFKHVGINWAKNSSDRVLEIASIFKLGGMGCTTTLALQSVTAEAEEQSRRYSLSPSKFVHLMRSAYERDIDTYTDIIWGLPGENVEEYLDGLDAVISTGLPSIKIHQLYLLPGTEFYDDRAKFGLEMLQEEDRAETDSGLKSDYIDYIVVSHPKMSQEDRIRGTRLAGISHILHNHDLGTIVDFYLARYGVAHRDVFNFFDELLLDKVRDFPEEEHPVLDGIRKVILNFANIIGLDETIFNRQLSEMIWFRKDKEGNIEYNEPWIRAFMNDFYVSLCRKLQICKTENERQILSNFVNYNVLISPKPAWKPAPRYSFQYNVEAIWKDMLREILLIGGDSSAKDQSINETWSDRSRTVRKRLSGLLSEPYLEEMAGPVNYQVMNPWKFVPSKTNLDWLLSNRSKHCKVRVIQ